MLLNSDDHDDDNGREDFDISKGNAVLQKKCISTTYSQMIS